MRAAFYECDITPPLGGFLWGHYSRKFAEDVIDRLYAKALVVEDDNGEVAAVLCVDSCAMPKQMHERVTKRITEYTGIPAERVCITANHTHWGAPVFDDPAIGCFADATYQDVFFRLAADAVILAYMRLDTAEATFGLDVVPGIAFCRDYVLEGGQTITFGRTDVPIERMLSDPDESLSVMTFLRDGKPVGAMINFACHQCCCGSIRGYTGDFSSILSKELKQRFGQDFVSLFVLGTCGDVNHINTDHSIKTPDGWYREMGRRIAVQTLAAMEHAQPVSGAVAVCKEQITLQKRTMDSAEAKAAVARRLENDSSLMRLRNMVYYQASNTETSMTLWIQVIRIGDVCIYGLPGEVFVKHGLRLKAQSPFAKNIVIENCNDYCGYIPTQEAFAENCDLYETALCHHSCLEIMAGDKIVDRLLEMSKTLVE